MDIYLSDDEIINEISSYTNPNHIWVEIWTSEYTIEIVITINDTKKCFLGTHKVIHCCDAYIGDYDDIIKLKTYGYRIVKLLRKNFKNSRIYSRLHYKA